MSGPESMQPHDRLLDEFLAGQGAVRSVYRETASEQAPAYLDAAILQAAQAAARPVPRARRSRWQTSMAAAAVMVLSFGVFLQVQRDLIVQQEILAAPDRRAAVDAPAAPAAVATMQDAAKTEAVAEALPREEVKAEKKQAAAITAKPRPAPRTEKRNSAAAVAASAPPAPSPPVMADAPAPLAAPAPRRESAAMEPPAAEAEAAARSAAAGVMRQESMQVREQSAVAIAPKAKASRSPAPAAAFVAPIQAAPSDEAMADAQAPLLSAECPALQKGQAPAIASATAAIAAARPLLVQRFGVEAITRHEPFNAQPRGSQWQVFGTRVDGVMGGVPMAEVCVSTGAVLKLDQSK